MISKYVMLILGTMCFSCQNNHVEKLNCVSDSKDVLKIVEEEWFKKYGKSIYDKKPFYAELKDSIWIVRGTVHSSKGGAPYAEVNSKNCEIIKLTHFK